MRSCTILSLRRRHNLLHAGIKCSNSTEMEQSMKRIVSYFLMIAVSLPLFFCSGIDCMAEETETTLDESSLYARSAVLMDADSGRILYAKEAEAVMPMASTTKIMTCILALENGNPEDLAEVSEYAASMPKVKLHVQPKESYRMGDLLYSLMLESHNDAAVVIAEHIGGSVEGFADMMNKKAAEIGCKNTYFITPNGLDAQKEILDANGSKVTVSHTTTARDLALIMSYCVLKSPQKDAFLAITQTPSYSFANAAGSRSFSCRNHNAFLNMMDGVISGKTGFTGKAGYCYTGALKRDERTYVVALLACGWPNNKSYKWSDAKKLMQYGIDSFQKRDIASEPVSQEWLREIPVKEAQTDYLYGKASAELAIEDQGEVPVLLMRADETVQVECSVERELAAPVKKGQQVGAIRYVLNGETLWERRICAAHDVEKADFPWFFRMAVQNFLF